MKELSKGKKRTKDAWAFKNLTEVYSLSWLIKIGYLTFHSDY